MMQCTTTHEINQSALFGQFRQHLHRGGEWWYFWRKGSTGPARTDWHRTGKQAEPPGGEAVYFGVHPTDCIPATNAKGEPKGPARVRAQNEHVQAISCLYGDFDGSHFADGKGGALAHIRQLSPAPSVVIDSGGGYHCYWLTREPFVLADDTARQQAASLQERWVRYIGSDAGAHDLARVLRVPGTYNRKYTPARPVTFVDCDLARLYHLADLAGYLPPEPEPPEPALIPDGPAPIGHHCAGSGQAPAGEGRRWLARYLLLARPGTRDAYAWRLALQLRDDRVPEPEARAIMGEYARGVPQPEGEPYTEREALRAWERVKDTEPRAPARRRERDDVDTCLDTAEAWASQAASWESSRKHRTASTDMRAFPVLLALMRDLHSLQVDEAVRDLAELLNCSPTTALACFRRFCSPDFFPGGALLIRPERAGDNPTDANTYALNIGRDWYTHSPECAAGASRVPVSPDIDLPTLCELAGDDAFAYASKTPEQQAARAAARAGGKRLTACYGPIAARCLAALVAAGGTTHMGELAARVGADLKTVSCKAGWLARDGVLTLETCGRVVVVRLVSTWRQALQAIRARVSTAGRLVKRVGQHLAQRIGYCQAVLRRASLTREVREAVWHRLQALEAKREGREGVQAAEAECAKRTACEAGA